MTYSVSAFATALEPDSRARGDRSLREADSVVASNFEDSGAGNRVLASTVNLDVPFVADGLLLLVAFWQKRPRISQHIQVSVPLISGGGNNQIHFQHLLLTLISGDVNIIISWRCLADPDLQAVRDLTDVQYPSTAQDAVRPLLLVGANLSSLVVHLLK